MQSFKKTDPTMLLEHTQNTSKMLPKAPKKHLKVTLWGVLDPPGNPNQQIEVINSKNEAQRCPKASWLESQDAPKEGQNR